MAAIEACVPVAGYQFADNAVPLMLAPVRVLRDPSRSKKEEDLMAKSTGKKRTKAKVRKNVVEGVAHIHATFNNTIIMITDRHGNAI